jgi:signal transduction histidine kinase
MILTSDRARRVAGYIVVAASIGFMAVFFAVSLADGRTDGLPSNGVLVLAFGIVLVLAVRSAPRNAAVWTMVLAVFLATLGEAAKAVGTARTGVTTADIEDGLVSFTPAAVDTASAVALSLPLWLWIPSSFLLTIHLLILFPSGRAASPLWRWIAWLSGAAMAVYAVATALATAPWVTTPYDELNDSAFGPVVVIANLWLMAATAASLVHLVRRYRASRGEERLQYRWVTWALGLNILAIFVIGPILGFTPDLVLAHVVFTGSLAAIPVAFGIAITKYRLFDVDVVISRSLLFVGLAAFITAVYALSVVGVGSLLGGSNILLSVGAIALIAVVFEPVRHRLQRWVNRLVYGQRATPYEVLSDLTERLTATEREDGLLDRMAQRLAAGTGADRAIVWTVDGAGFRAVACAPPSGRPPSPVAARHLLPGVPVQIEHDGEVLGVLSIDKRRGEALRPVEARLLEDLASSAGLVMRRLRLDAALAQKARELAESRRRLVDADNVERRRLERALDEGPQQRIVALERDLEHAALVAEREEAASVATLIGQLASEAQGAIDQIQSLARGIYPPLLEADGLAAAIRALADHAPADVRVRVVVAERHPLAAEAAVYFCVAEALTNASKHGEGPIEVQVSDTHDGLSFEVSDAGPGFDPALAERGAGLDNMADRIDALGGDLVITSRPGDHTTVAGTIPVCVGVTV